MPIKVGEVKIEDIELLPPPWFGVSHGVDGCEEALRLDEVQAFRACWRLLGEIWRADLRINLKGGGYLDTSLSEKGYEAFLKAVGGEHTRSRSRKREARSRL